MPNKIRHAVFLLLLFYVIMEVNHYWQLGKHIFVQELLLLSEWVSEWVRESDREKIYSDDDIYYSIITCVCYNRWCFLILHQMLFSNIKISTRHCLFSILVQLNWKLYIYDIEMNIEENSNNKYWLYKEFGFELQCKNGRICWWM